jgi:hypothetical protein
MPRFKLGERVALNGLLGELHGGEAIGTVVLVVPDRHGMDVFDEYGIAFEDSRQLRVRSFQLTHVVLTDAESQEKAASLALPGDLTRKNQLRCPTRMNHDYRGRT